MNPNSIQIIRRIIPLKIIFIFALFTTVIIILGLVFYSAQKNKLFTEQKDNLKAVATLKVSQISSWRSELISDAVGIRENLPLLQSIKAYFNSQGNDNGRLKKWITSIFTIYDYRGVILLDNSLRVRLTAVPSDTTKFDDIKNELLETLNTHNIVITDLHRSQTQNFISLDILIPLKDPENESSLTGIVVLRVDPEKILFPLIKTWPTSSKSAESLLLRKQGDGILYMNELRHKKNTAFRLTLPSTDEKLLASFAVKGLFGFQEGVDYRNIPVIGYVINIPGTNWFMVVKIDKEELEIPLRRIFYFTVIIIILLVLINALFLGYWIWDQRIRAVEDELEIEKTARESEEKLFKSEELYRRLFDNMFNGFAYCRMIYQDGNPSDFIYLSVNKAFEEHTGLRNVIGKKISEVVPGILETDMELIRRYGRVSLTGRPEEFEIYLESLRMWFSIAVYSPEKEYFVAVFDVITKRKQIEAELKLREERFRSTLDNMMEGCQIIGFDWKYIYINDTADVHNRRPKEELLGKRYIDVWPGIEDTKVFQRIRKCMEDRIPDQMETEFVFPDGVTGWFDLRIQPVPEGVFILSIDITERRRIEKALAENEKRFRSLYENITIGIYRTTLDGRILLANSAMLNMMGFDSFEQLSQRNLEKEGYEPDYPRSRFHRTMEEMGKVSGLESAWKKKDGTVLYVRESASAVRDQNGRILYYDGTVEDITDRKIIEKALEDERNLLRTLLDLLPSIIFVKDCDSRFVMANSACAEFMGAASSQDLIGKTDFEFYKSEAAATFRSDELNVLKGIPLINKEEGSSSPTGNQKNLLTTKVPLRDAKGNIVGLVGTCFDITELRKVEEAMIESEDKFKYVFEHSTVGKSITSPSGEINVNTAFCEMLGYSKQELTKTKWAEITHPSDIQLTNAELDKILSGEKKLSRFIKRYIHKNGSVVWAEVGTSLRRDADGKPWYFLSTVNDITVRKKAEEALHLKNLVFDASIAANSIADLNGKISEANNAFLLLWNYPDKEVIIGKPISDFLNNAEEAKVIIKSLQESGKWEGDYTALRMDGSTFTAHGLATDVKDENGNVIGFQSAVIDVSDRKNQEDEIRRLNEGLEMKVIQRTRQLESANKELEAFSYSVSHDLRAPLRAVHSYTNILLEDYGKSLDEEGKRICGIISSSAIQMGELIDDLLSFSRIGRSSLNPSYLDMRSIASQAFTEITGTNIKNSPGLKLSRLHKACGDANLIRLVWNNLISNAVKYSSKAEHPEVIIGSVHKDGSVIYSVKDNGVGFDKQYIHKLFGVFQRLHSSNEFEGNGVGLAIVQRIIHMHGGKTWAEGEIDKGATFFFSLPDVIMDKKQKNRQN